MGAEPAWLDPRTVVLIHYHQLAEHGGAAGISNQGILQSSLASPRQQYVYGEVDLYDLVTRYRQPPPAD